MSENDKTPSTGISRREFIKDASLIIGGAAVCSTALTAGCRDNPTTTEVPSTEISAYDISGAHEIISLFAARLGDLNGKRIAGLAADPTKWQPHRTFPYIFEQIKSRYPDAIIIPQTEFVMGLGIDDDGVAQAVKERGADACILGNAN